MVKLFIWDFHGTLEKGNERAVLAISNEILKQQNYSQRFKQSDCNRLYGKKWYEFFEELLPDKPHEEHLRLQAESVTYGLAHPEIIAKYIQPNDHSHEVLEAIAVHNDQILISNCNSDSLDLFINTIDIQKFFTQGVNAFAANNHSRKKGSSKKDILLGFVLKRGYRYRDIISVGDSPDDVELAHLLGGTSYLYTHPGTNHRKGHADHYITDLREVLQKLH